MRSIFRNAGVLTFGVDDLFDDIDDVRAHGRDERVGMKQFNEHLEFPIPFAPGAVEVAAKATKISATENTEGAGASTRERPHDRRPASRSVQA